MEAERPTRQPSSAASKPFLQAIELHYRIYLVRLDIRTTVTSEGMLRSVRTENKSYGGNDKGAKSERIEVREGRLTPEQTEDLVHLFAGWDSLSSKPYGGVPDGGDISVRYGNKIVSGGSGVPKRVTDIRARLDELARSLSVMKP